MGAKYERQRLAKELYCKLGLSQKEVAGLLQVSISSIERYAKEDRERGQDWIKTKELSELGYQPQTKRFRQCLNLILAQAEEALIGLSENSEIAPEKRASTVAGIMDTIHKATNTAKKMDPEMNLELVVTEVLRIVSASVLDLAPSLAAVWHEVTYAIEERIQKVKDKWQ